MSPDEIEIFVEMNCPSCALLKKYLENKEVLVTEKNIDTDPENKVDALMLNIYNIPALKWKDTVLHAHEMFTPEGKLLEEKVDEFLKL